MFRRLHLHAVGRGIIIVMQVESSVAARGKGARRECVRGQARRAAALHEKDLSEREK